MSPSKMFSLTTNLWERCHYWSIFMWGNRSTGWRSTLSKSMETSRVDVQMQPVLTLPLVWLLSVWQDEGWELQEDGKGEGESCSIYPWLYRGKRKAACKAHWAEHLSRSDGGIGLSQLKDFPYYNHQTGSPNSRSRSIWSQLNIYLGFSNRECTKKPSEAFGFHGIINGQSDIASATLGCHKPKPPTAQLRTRYGIHLTPPRYHSTISMCPGDQVAPWGKTIKAFKMFSNLNF